MKAWSHLFLLSYLALATPSSATFAQEDLNPSAIDSGAAELCTKVFTNSWLPYQDLAQFLPKNFRTMPQLPTHKGLSLKLENCQTDPSIQMTIQKALSFHTRKIAFLLPLSLWPPTVAQAVKDQIMSMSQRQGLDFQKNVLWIDTAGDTRRLQAALAQIVFQQHAAVLIGGLHQNEAPVLAQWGERLRIPTIILNRRAKITRSPHVFAMAPDPEAMASTLLHQMQKASVKKLAIMMSQANREGYFLEALQKLMPSFGIQALGPYLYVPSDFSSIDGHIRTILHLDDPARDEEKLALLKKMKEKAQAEGLPYEGSELTLPPQLEVDALLIIDHFKSVRHISKVLTAYNVKKLNMFGLPKWRALELIDPPDPLLKSAQFVDYIGNYLNLPYGIQTKLLQGEFLIEGQEAGLVDLKLLSSHAFYAAQQVAGLDKVPRFQLYQHLAKAQNQANPFFTQASIFRGQQTAYWPSFVLSVGEDQLQQVASFPDGAMIKPLYKSSTSVTKPASSQ